MHCGGSWFLVGCYLPYGRNVIHKNDKLKYVHCITIIRLNDLAESVRALYDFKDDICVLDFQNICYKYYGPFLS